jgi:hypothetical protein
MIKKNNKSFGDWFKLIVELIAAIVSIGGIGYGVGRWQSHIEHKTEIMEIRQQYNVEISNLKIDYNNRIVELQNELKIIELSKK